MQSRGIEQPLRFAATLSDGQRLWAFRLASDGKPPSLYLQRLQADGSRGTIIASEPLCDDRKNGQAEWQALPVAAVVTLEGHRCEVAAAELQALA